MIASVIDPGTIDAYMQANYRVSDGQGFRLRIGSRSPELAGLHRLCAVDCSAFVTACNPFGEPLDDAQNEARQQALRSEIELAGLKHVEGVGQDPSGKWKGEPSFLILGLDLEAAKALGRRFEQNAVVWCGAAAVPQLILLR